MVFLHSSNASSSDVRQALVPELLFSRPCLNSSGTKCCSIVIHMRFRCASTRVEFRKEKNPSARCAGPYSTVRFRRPAETGECDGAARRALPPALTGCPDCARDGASYAKNRTSKSRREVPQPVIGASRALLVPAVVLAFAPFGAGPKPPLPPPPRARVGRVPPRPTPFLRQAARAYTVDRSPPS